MRRLRNYSWCGAVLLLVWACGDFTTGTESGNPTNPNVGTESGNPILPPRNPVTDMPMAVVEPAAGAAEPTIDSTLEPSTEPTPEQLGEIPDLNTEPVADTAPTGTDGSTAPSAPSAGGLGNTAGDMMDYTGSSGFGGGMSAAGGTAAGGNPSTAEGPAPIACESSQCTALAEAAVTDLATPMATSSLQASMCQTDGSCECVGDGGFSLVLVSGAMCHLTDRFGQCVFTDQDFNSCDPTVAGSCGDTCQRAFNAEAEAGAALNTSVEDAQCLDPEGCRFVLRVEGTQSCVVGGDALNLRMMDCTAAQATLTAAP